MEGRDRTYRLALPTGYDGTTPAPLLFDFHGLRSSSMQHLQVSRAEAKATARGYIVVTPQALLADPDAPQSLENPTFWSLDVKKNRDVSFTDQMLDSLGAELCIDERRIFATDLSNGGGFSMVLGCARGSRFAAVAPVSGLNLVEHCPNRVGVSVLAFHGDKDAAVAYDGKELLGEPASLPSVPDAMSGLAKIDGCRRAPARSRPFADIAVRTWRGCDRSRAVILYTVLGGGHNWPGRDFVAEFGEETIRQVIESRGQDFQVILDALGYITTSIDATDVMLDFFDRHAAPAARS